MSDKETIAEGRKQVLTKALITLGNTHEVQDFLKRLVIKQGTSGLEQLIQVLDKGFIGSQDTVHAAITACIDKKSFTVIAMNTALNFFSKQVDMFEHQDVRSTSSEDIAAMAQPEATGEALESIFNVSG